MRKRALSFLLAMILTMALLPFEAFAESGLPIDEKAFPDANFRQYVLDTLDKDHNTRLSPSEIVAVTWINVSGKEIKDMKGVEHFTALTGLDCGINELTALNVSANTELTELYCYTNKLTSLDVSKNTKLKTLRCQTNQLTKLDLSKNTELDYLNFAVNQISSIDLSKNTKLTSLQCGSNKLTKLDLTKNTALQAVECTSNKLTSLDLSHCPDLQLAHVCGNQIKELDLRSCKAFSKALKETAKVTYYAYNDACYIANSPYLAVVDYTTAVRIGSGAKPKITAQPKSVTAASGKAVTFTVKATGKDLTYRWLYLKKGATEYKQRGSKPTLTVKAAAGLNGTKYRCIVRNGDWIRFTKAAKLKVAEKPRITYQTGNVTAKSGQKVSFKVKASGTDLKFQWYCMKPGAKKWVRIAKATKASWTVKASKKVNGYKYRCLVYNEAGKAYSKAARLTVK